MRKEGVEAYFGKPSEHEQRRSTMKYRCKMSASEEVDFVTFITELTSDIVAELVDKPENTNVTSSKSKNTLILTVSTLNGEIGKIIGKNGRTVEALRTLLRAMCAKERLNVVIEAVVSPESTV